jgi:hypothetical protein
VRAGHGAFAREGVDPGAIDVVHPHRPAARQQVARHAATHVAGAYQGDGA